MQRIVAMRIAEFEAKGFVVATERGYGFRTLHDLW